MEFLDLWREFLPLNELLAACQVIAGASDCFRGFDNKSEDCSSRRVLPAHRVIINTNS